MSFNSKCANIHMSVTSLDHNVSIPFVNNIYLKIFSTKIIHEDLFSFKIFMNFSNSFVCFMSQNVLIHSSPKISYGARFVNTSKLYNNHAL